MSFWENKNVLLTGSTGFVGSHLRKKLESQGAKVTSISRSSSSSNTLQVDVCHFEKLNQIIKKNKIQICFHLAGESLVERGQLDPYGTFKANTEGTLNILESSRINGLEKIVIASTSHVYGDNVAPYREEYFPRPSRPYETSKTCADLIAQSYADSFNLPVLIPRFVNIYGPGDVNFQRLIPKTMKSVVNNKNPKMWGGDVRRDYIYIEDVVNAYIMLGEISKRKLEKNRIYNFGSGNLISVRDLIKKIIQVSGKELKIVKDEDDEREDEIILQYVSSEKAKRILGFKSKVALNKGLRETFEWYKEYLGK